MEHGVGNAFFVGFKYLSTYWFFKCQSFDTFRENANKHFWTTVYSHGRKRWNAEDSCKIATVAISPHLAMTVLTVWKFGNFSRQCTAKIPSNYFFTKDLYCITIWRKFLGLRKNSVNSTLLEISNWIDFTKYFRWHWFFTLQSVEKWKIYSH